MPFSRPRSSTVFPALLAALVTLTSAPPGQAEATSPTGIAPQSVGGQPVVQIVAGRHHSCALVANGWVYCWGRNLSGQLGDGTTNAQSLTPVRVSDLTNVTHISANRDSSCAVRSSGRVFCWGNNQDGQLGDGTTTDRRSPVRVRDLTSVTQVASGNNHSCALRSSGRVFCWGQNGQRQLGDGTTTNRLTPVRVNGSGVTGATQISAGAAHSCLLRQNGRVTCWGNDQFGQLGRGTTSIQGNPAPVIALTNVTQIDGASWHNCALRGNGRVFCWGWNSSGQVGDGTFAVQATPRRVIDLTSAVHVAAGGSHSCAIRATGRVFCWGGNVHGQLGDGTTTNASTPVRVVGARLVNPRQIVAADNHSCGIRPNGRAYCWGSNQYGRLGDGTTTDSPVPVLVID